MIGTDSNVQTPIGIVIDNLDARNNIAWSRFNDSRSLIKAAVRQHTVTHSAVLVSKGYTADIASQTDLDKITTRLTKANAV